MIKIFDFLSSIVANPLTFVQHDNVDSCCEEDCGRYINLLQKTLSLRCFCQEFSLFESGVNANAKFYSATDYALIDLGETDSAYRKKIGDATQSLINRSIRLGFKFSEFNARDFDDDIREILTSADHRSDRPVPQEWFYPDYKLPVWTKGLCERHKEHSFGVFNSEGKLIALCTVRFFGEIASFNFIIGHNNYLSLGVMHFMIYSLRSYLINNRAEISFLHYMWMGNPSYANYYHFKSGTGFRGSSICLVDNNLLLSGIKKSLKILLNNNFSIKNIDAKKDRSEFKVTPKLYKFKSFHNFKDPVTVSKISDLVELSFSRLSESDLVSVIGEKLFSDILRNCFYGNESVDVKFFEDRFLFKIKLVVDELPSCSLLIFDSFANRMRRGDVLNLFIDFDDVDEKNLIYFFNKFKGSLFQVLVFNVGILNGKQVVFILLIRI